MHKTLNTFLLAVVAASALSVAIQEPRAEEGGVVCETFDFDWDTGRKNGAENVAQHKVWVQRMLVKHHAAGYTRTVYMRSLPIRSNFNGSVVAESGVICLSR